MRGRRTAPTQRPTVEQIARTIDSERIVRHAELRAAARQLVSAVDQCQRRGDPAAVATLRRAKARTVLALRPPELPPREPAR